MRPDLRPMYHFLYLPDSLGAEWLFDAARRYWDVFRPTVIPAADFLRLLPAGSTLTVTVLALRDRMAAIGVEIAQAAPTALLDPVIYDTFEQARAELDRRAEQFQPFGVPLATPTFDLPDIPTPRLPATRPPSGFVTATPSPGPTRPPSPTPPIVLPTQAPAVPNVLPTPVVPPGEPQPIPRTPGPITGGDAGGGA